MSIGEYVLSELARAKHFLDACDSLLRDEAYMTPLNDGNFDESKTTLRELIYETRIIVDVVLDQVRTCRSEAESLQQATIAAWKKTDE